MHISLLSLTLLLASATGISARSSLNPNIHKAHALRPLTTRNTAHLFAIRSPQSSGCDADLDPCGNNCIPAGYTCCPDETGGCPSDWNCQEGDNGAYGCCPDGEECVGDGGSTTDLDKYEDMAGGVRPVLGVVGMAGVVAFAMGFA